MKEQKKQILRNDEMINYLFRPAKNIERKMICEALSKLSVISNLQDYQYVGFGSTYFADFTLFHKRLGIQKLISIEGDSEMEERVKFNKPYSCIEIKSGMSVEKLPEVNWRDQETILWLDYTEALTGYMFQDMATFFNRALPGSVFIISVNVEIKDEDAKTVNEKIKKKIERDPDVRKRVRGSIFKTELNRSDYYSLIQSIVAQEISELLNERNKTEAVHLEYNQIFNFVYKDGQAMLTIGGILFKQPDEVKVRHINFNSLDFIRSGSDHFEIYVPHLTHAEIHALDRHLPKFNTDLEVKQRAFDELKGVISTDAIEKYARIYRYFPTFAESNVK